MFSINSPLFSKLDEYTKRHRISFSMPGHKGGKGIMRKFKKKLLQYDVTELADTESLHNPKSEMLKAKKLASEFFGSLDTYFLVNGSTGGIYAMLASACSVGDTIIVNRACHVSVINACAMLGINPVFICQDIIDNFSIPTAINQKTLIHVLDKHNNAKAVLITSPSYYGICSDIETISKITRARGIPLLVDEAHGAHFAVDTSIFPRTAISQGADMCVQSAHKTLNAINQASFLHLGSDMINRQKLKSVLSMLQTSSPCYPIVASADIARDRLSFNGSKKWNATFSRCESLRDKISSKTNVKFITKLMNGSYNIENIDETRIVMNFCAYDTTGFDVSDLLRTKYNIDVEMADLFNIVCIATPSNTVYDFYKLENAIINICKKLEPSTSEPAFPTPPIPPMKMTPQSAFYSKGKFVKLDDAIGRISRCNIIAYPPAVPIICMGESITCDSLSYINALKDIGAEIVGLTDNGLISIVE